MFKTHPLESTYWRLLAEETGQREPALRAFLAFHGLQVRDLAERTNAHRTQVTRCLSGERSPAWLLDCLAALGIPSSLLPEPTSNSPRRLHGGDDYKHDSPCSAST